MKRLLKSAARVLPETQQRGLSQIYYGLRTFLGRNAVVIPSKAIPVIAAPPKVTWQIPANFAGPISVGQFESIVDTYNRADEGVREQILSDVFDAVSLRHSNVVALRTTYADKLFSVSPVYQVAIAAADAGSGKAIDAARRLEAAHQKTPSAALGISAARCVMRPAGNEVEAARILDVLAGQYPDDVRIGVNQATAHFVIGNSARANDLLAQHKANWVELLGPELVQDGITLSAELNAAIASKTTNRVTKYDSDMYLEKNIRAHWEPYQYDMITTSKQLMFGWLVNFFADALSRLAKNDHASEVYNFGVMCAEGDAIAAQQNPNVKFVGVDRQKTTADLNEIAYPLDNMSFVTGEMEDVIDALPEGRDRVLFHARTATLCFPEKLRKLYRQCFEKGFSTIALFENHSVSHAHYKFFSFSEMPDISITYKNNQFIHNYERLLADGGFEIFEKQVMFAPLVSPFSIVDLGSTHIFAMARRKN